MRKKLRLILRSFNIIVKWFQTLWQMAISPFVICFEKHLKKMKIEQLAVQEPILKAMQQLGYTELTAIQEKAIPLILEGKDVFGHSSTGSGKTAAFGIPILQNVVKGKGIQCLILTPTRELCVQVTDSLRSLGKFLQLHITSVYGGVGIEPQIHALRRAEIVVATPGRTMDHVERGTISFSNLRYFVLDEADKMFEMGFLEAVEEIMQYIPNERQTLLFSATLPSTVKHLIQKHLKNPVTLKGELHVDKLLLKQTYIVVPQQEKFSLLVHFLKKNQDEGLALVFCGTRHQVDLLTKNLKVQGIHVMAIHGGLSQSKRLYALDALKKEQINVLVATDVAARGLDIKHVSHVYNYDVPNSALEYVHRIGRTARAGMKGDAVTLLSERDYDNFNTILRDRTLDIQREQMPQIERVVFQKDMGGDRGGGFRGGRGGGFRGSGRGSNFRGSGREGYRGHSGARTASSHRSGSHQEGSRYGGRSQGLRR